MGTCESRKSSSQELNTNKQISCLRHMTMEIISKIELETIDSPQSPYVESIFHFFNSLQSIFSSLEEQYFGKEIKSSNIDPEKFKKLYRVMPLFLETAHFSKNEPKYCLKNKISFDLYPKDPAPNDSNIKIIEQTQKNVLEKKENSSEILKLSENPKLSKEPKKEKLKLSSEQIQKEKNLILEIENSTKASLGAAITVAFPMKADQNKAILGTDFKKGFVLILNELESLAQKIKSQKKFSNAKSIISVVFWLNILESIESKQEAIDWSIFIERFKEFSKSMDGPEIRNEMIFYIFRNLVEKEKFEVNYQSWEHFYLKQFCGFENKNYLNSRKEELKFFEISFLERKEYVTDNKIMYAKFETSNLKYSVSLLNKRLLQVENETIVEKTYDKFENEKNMEFYVSYKERLFQKVYCKTVKPLKYYLGSIPFVLFENLTIETGRFLIRINKLILNNEPKIAVNLNYLNFGEGFDIRSNEEIKIEIITYKINESKNKGDLQINYLNYKIMEKKQFEVGEYGIFIINDEIKIIAISNNSDKNDLIGKILYKKFEDVWLVENCRPHEISTSLFIYGCLFEKLIGNQKNNEKNVFIQEILKNTTILYENKIFAVLK